MQTRSRKGAQVAATVNRHGGIRRPRRLISRAQQKKPAEDTTLHLDAKRPQRCHVGRRAHEIRSPCSSSPRCRTLFRKSVLRTFSEMNFPIRNRLLRLWRNAQITYEKSESPACGGTAFRIHGSNPKNPKSVLRTLGLGGTRCCFEKGETACRRRVVGRAEQKKARRGRRAPRRNLAPLFFKVRITDFPEGGGFPSTRTKQADTRGARGSMASNVLAALRACGREG